MPQLVRPLVWVGSSKRALKEMPEEVQDHIGYALHLAQTGDKHVDAKPLSGFGGTGVVEVVSDHRGDTFRGIYTVRMQHAVYVLHAFQKKSKHGIATARTEMVLISAGCARPKSSTGRTRVAKDRLEFERGSDNVFADLGFPNAEEHLLKARLVQKISAVLTTRGLTQVQAAEILGVRQPDVSNMLRGQFRRISVERLLQHLVALGQDVEIIVKPAPHDASRAPGLRIA